MSFLRYNLQFHCVDKLGSMVPRVNTNEKKGTKDVLCLFKEICVRIHVAG